MFSACRTLYEKGNGEFGDIMSASSAYEALTTQSLPRRLGSLETLVAHAGAPERWEVREVGDGNLNLVFIVSGEAGSVIVKQALPYVRLVGDSWPLPLERAFFEYHALIRQAERDPGSVPEVFHFDEEQALIVMEFLQPHTILRAKLIAGEKVTGLGERLGVHCARTAFRGSDLSLPAARKKADAALFLGNVELCDITESLVFTDPYFEAERNHHTPELGPVVARLRADGAMRVKAQQMLMRFTSGGETMVHGDLHTGSIMCSDSETRVIDPEFACYAPMGFDPGMLLANFLMAYLSQPAHRSAEDLGGYQAWILSVIEAFCASFAAEFSRLWRSERTGLLFARSLLEDQEGDASEAALSALLALIWQDAMGFCGIEMHRRCLSLAHNADFESIPDSALRAGLEARNLMLGRELAVNAAAITTPDILLERARRFNSEDCL